MYFDPSEPGAAFRAADRLAARLMPHTRLVCASRKRTKKKNRKSWNHPITVKGVPALSVVFSNVSGFFRDREGHLLFFLFKHRAAL